MYITWLCALQNDYLSHLVLYGGLTDALKTFKDGQRFQLLDLGCGDAHYIADALKRSGAGGRLQQYTGVDLAEDALEVRSMIADAHVRFGLSPSALVHVSSELAAHDAIRYVWLTLQLARRNITDVTNGSDCKLDIQKANMLEYAAAADAEPAFDAALTSFAAHHLRTDEKEVRTAACYGYCGFPFVRVMVTQQGIAHRLRHRGALCLWGSAILCGHIHTCRCFSGVWAAA